MDYTTEKETLQDKKNGKQKPWREKKVKVNKLSESFDRLELYKRSEKVYWCGHTLGFKTCDDCDRKKLVYGYFCHDRLCPMCNWRRSEKLFAQIIKVLHRAKQQKPFMRFIYLTLTVKNVSGPDLYDAMTDFLEGFNRLFKYKEVDDVIDGYVRSVEVTYDKERFITPRLYKRKTEYYKNLGLRVGDSNPNCDTYHPHIHVLIGVNSSYFNSGYINHDSWTSLFKRAASLDYTPVVHVKAVRPKRTDENNTVAGAVSETAKYSVKDADYLFDDEGTTDEVVSVLAVALKKRRLIAYGKLFRKIHKELDLQDVESKNAELADEVPVDCKCSLCQSTLIDQLYRWNLGVGNYLNKNDNLSDIEKQSKVKEKSYIQTKLRG